jgi:ABC-type phosphate transport system substrate-binding protein
MSRATRQLAAAVCVAVFGVMLTGCGVEIAASGSDGESTTVLQSAPAQQRQDPVAKLPKRTAGELTIAGEREGSLTSNAVTGFAKAQKQVQPRYGAVGATEGFARLCRGEVDVVDSSRRISRAELAVCNSNGLEIRTPIQIASDAIVLATRNESDVGGDCLTVADVAKIYRRGSTTDNWSKLGFDDLPLKATGPGQSANAFSNFASQVLGVLSNATLEDLRSDYRPRGSDDEIRTAIIGRDRARRVPALVENEVRKARSAAAGQRRIYVGNAVADARDRVLRSIRAENIRRARRKKAVLDPAALAQRNLRRVQSAKRLARDRAGKRFDRRFDLLRTTRTRELLARARRNGVVGFVRFSYYEAYEDQLRPLEIDPGPARDAAIAAADKRARAAGTTPPQRLPTVDEDGKRTPNCVFPSQLTITTGEYPLARRILLYTSTRGLQRPEVRGFLAYALRNAQQLATDSRLVPITNRLRADQYKFVTGTAIEPTTAPLPGEQTTGAAGTRSQPTRTTAQPPASQSAARDKSSSAAQSSSVPGISSGASATQEESP